MRSSTPAYRLPAWYLILALVVAVMAASSYGVARTRAGDWMSTWRQVSIDTVSQDQGFAVTAPTARADWTSEHGPSPALMLEDRRVLSPPNAPLDDVRTLGQGRFRFSADAVYFSATDNSDPRTNGRHYSIVYPPIERAPARALYMATLAAIGLFVLLTVFALPLKLISRLLVRAALGAPHRFASALTPGPARPLPPNIVRWVVAACVAAFLATAIANATYLSRVGRWTALWQQAPIVNISPEIGHAYYADLGTDAQSSQLAPSPALVLEDGRPVGPSNALHADIRTLGQGRFSFWAGGVYFAASDNSDPRTNGRHYVAWFPPISRVQSRLIYAFTALFDVLVLLFTLSVISRGGLGTRMAARLAEGRQSAATGLAVAAAAGLILIAWTRATPSIAPFADALWVLELPLALVASVAVRWQFGAALPRRIMTASALAVVIAYVLLTGFSPHRSQGCHTNNPLTLWDAFCLSGDSGSYLNYSVGSTRQPLYPWFNHALTTGTSFEAGAYLKNSVPGTLRSSPDPLARVVHTQIVLTLGASLLACIALMQLFGAPLPATLFVWLFDHQFFSNTELNTVLTEPLVLTMVMLLLAVLAWYASRPRPWLIPFAAIFCAGAYLSRQAGAFSGVKVAAMVLHALATNWRRAWPACAAACVAFVGVAAVPDIYGYLATGSLGTQQTNLQYQYRVAHAMQYLDEEDVRRAPDEESRAWLAAALSRRNIEHAKVEAEMKGPYYRMVYYVDRNLYAVATPVGEPQPPAEFLMRVATPILERHWREYVKFGLSFWVLGLSWPEVARIGLFGFSAWFLYAAVFVAIVTLRNRYALVAAACVLAHWSHVLLASFFAAPIPRMVGASELLVIIGAVTAGWGMLLRLAGMRWDRLRRTLQSYAQAGEAE